MYMYNCNYMYTHYVYSSNNYRIRNITGTVYDIVSIAFNYENYDQLLLVERGDYPGNSPTAMGVPL